MSVVQIKILKNVPFFLGAAGFLLVAFLAWSFLDNKLFIVFSAFFILDNASGSLENVFLRKSYLTGENFFAVNSKYWNCFLTVLLSTTEALVIFLIALFHITKVSIFSSWPTFSVTRSLINVLWIMFISEEQFELKVKNMIIKFAVWFWR